MGNRSSSRGRAPSQTGHSVVPASRSASQTDEGDVAEIDSGVCGADPITLRGKQIQVA